MGKFILAILISFLPFKLVAQELTIKSFTELTNDITARSNPRNDLNGNPCSLVKVRMAVDNATFKGMVIGEIKHDGGEYYVYLPEGAKKITISAPNYLPIDVKFEDYGIGALVAKTTYLLSINNSGNMNISSLKDISFRLVPEDATLKLNGAILDVYKGYAQIKLPNGSYQYSVSSKYYYTKDSIFTITNDMDSSIMYIELDKYKSKLNIKSYPLEADVYLDNNKIGTTPISDFNIEGGEYTCSLIKTGYCEDNFKINVIDSVPLYISHELKEQKYGKVTITSNVLSMLEFDNKHEGFTPYSAEILPGLHKFKLYKYGYKEYLQELEVEAGKSYLINAKLKRERSNYKKIKYDNSFVFNVGYSRSTQLSLNGSKIPAIADMGALGLKIYGVYMGMDFGSNAVSSRINMKFGAGITYNFDANADKAIAFTPFIGYARLSFLEEHYQYDSTDFLYGCNLSYYYKLLSIGAEITSNSINISVGLRIWKEFWRKW